MKKKRSVPSLRGGTGKWIPVLIRVLTLTLSSQIFPGFSAARRPIAKDSALAKIKEKRAIKKALAQNFLNTQS